MCAVGRAAQGDGRLRAGIDAVCAAHPLQGMARSFAFWPPLSMAQPGLAPAQQAQVLADAVDMFLGGLRSRRAQQMAQRAHGPGHTPTQVTPAPG